MDDKEWKEKIKACVKCGTCLPVCPIYRETEREPLSARGKLALLDALLDQRFQEDRLFYDLLANCLLCGACAEQCPGGVKADALILEGRNRILNRVGAAGARRLLAKEILPFPERMKAIRLGQDWIWRQIPKDRGLLLRLFPAASSLPLLEKPFFLERSRVLPGPSPSIGGSKSLGLFVGCSINYFHPPVGEAVYRLLSPLGRIVLPKDQTCCGLPAFTLGDLETARRLAKQNVLAFAEDRTEAVVVPCSSCAAHILTEYPRLLEKEPDLQEELVDFLKKTEELSRFLVREGFTPSPPLDASPLRVVFHDPCHGRRKLHIRDEPRRLLLSRTGLSLSERKEQRCCGAGGLFRLSHPDLSRKIGGRSYQDLEASDAQVLATSCMACLMQLESLASEQKNGWTVKHWAELLA